jgi:hypothetical protein
VNCPYPGPAAGTVGVIVALDPGIVRREGAQGVVAVLLDQNDPGCTASRSMVVVVVLLIPAGAGVAVALRFPMFRSIRFYPGYAMEHGVDKSRPTGIRGMFFKPIIEGCQQSIP